MPLWKELVDQLILPDVDDKGIHHRARYPFTNFQRQRSKDGIGTPFFKLAALGSGQSFTLVVPDLSVLGVSLEVLQQVLSQFNRSHV